MLVLALFAVGLAPAGHAQGSLPPGAYTGSCDPWLQVNDGAFGLGTGGDSSYSSEEGFEVLVFQDRLYLGMEADNTLGARLWRTRAGVTTPGSQSDWEEVIADAAGRPFGIANITQNDHVDSLAEFNGYLYVSTANGGSSTYGTRLFRSASADPFSASPDAWSDAIASYGAGFGDVHNTNFKDMRTFDGWLCGGTQNWNTGAQVWCSSDGTTWQQKNWGGFGAGADDPANVAVWSGYVYDGALYFGVQNTGANPSTATDDVARLFRTTDLSGTPTWTEVYSGAAGSRRVDILGDLDGYLYISVASAAGIVILRSSSGDAGSWSQVNSAGMDGDAANSGAVVDGATVYNGALYVGVTNLSAGFELWRTSGVLQSGGPLVDWAQVDGSGLGDPDNYYTELIPFNGYLYAWTSNYATGQQVLRSKCPICQSRTIDGAGSYSFDGVGAALDFAAEELDSVEVCVYPGAFPGDQSDDKPVKRHYRVNPSPAAGAFTADLTLSYTDDEFSASDITAESTTYLARWTGSEWSACAEGSRSRDVAGNTATCRSVSTFSTWSVAGSYQPPTAVTILFFGATAGDGAILLEWETASELDILGFHLYRRQAPAGERLRLNAALIPGQMPGSPVGAHYQFEDRTARPGVPYDYWLEAMDVYGQAELHGPVPATLAEAVPNAVSLSRLSARGADPWRPLGLVVALPLLAGCTVFLAPRRRP